MIPRIMLEYPRIRGSAQVLRWGLVHLKTDKGKEGFQSGWTRKGRERRE
jgi:hypothetical protein